MFNQFYFFPFLLFKKVLSTDMRKPCQNVATDILARYIYKKSSNTGVPRGADFCAKVMEYFQILMEYFQKVMEFWKILVAPIIGVFCFANNFPSWNKKYRIKFGISEYFSYLCSIKQNKKVEGCNTDTDNTDVFYGILAYCGTHIRYAKNI